MLLTHLIQRRRRRFSIITRFFSSPPPPPPRLSSVFKQEPLSDLTRILRHSDPIEPALDRIEPFLTSQLLSSFIRKERVSVSWLRFIFWTMRLKRLKTWRLHDVIVDVVVKEENGIELYRKAIQEVREAGVSVPADAFVVLINGYGRIGDVEKVVEVFEMMREYGTEPDVYVYNAMMYVMVKMVKMVKEEMLLLAWMVYEEMLKRGCEPDRGSYNVLLYGLCKSGLMRDALEVWDSMIGKGVRPNSVMYTIVVSGLCNVGRTDDALRLFEEMRRNVCKPDLVAYNALLSGFCKFRGMDDAFELLRLFEKDGYVLGIKGYSCIIDGLFKAGRFEEAVQWFRELCERITPDVVVYTIVIRGYCKAGLVTEASGLLHEMNEKGLVPDTQCYNSLVKGFCDIGLLKDAYSLKLEILKNECFPDSRTYTILICGMCKKGLVGEAENIFEEMKKVGCSPTVVTFNALIDGLCRAGDIERANILFSKMLKPSVLLWLSEGKSQSSNKACIRERIRESRSLLVAYKDLMRLADGRVMPDLTTWNTLIKGLWRSGDVDGALERFKVLRTPDSITYGTLIDGYYRSDKAEQAFRMFGQMKEKGIAPSASVYRSMMTWSCRKSKVSASFGLWIEYLRSLKNRDEETLNLVEVHFQKGQISEAVKALLESDFSVKEFDLAPYTIWLIGLCKAQRVEEAYKIFQVLVENNVHVTAPSCVMLISGLCKEKKMDLARDVFIYTLESGIKLMPKVCNQLLISLWRSRDNREQVFDLLGKMEYVGYDLNAHLYGAMKSVLLSYVFAPVMPFRETRPSQMAPLGWNSRNCETKQMCASV